MEIVDLVLVKHIRDYTDSTYLFKAPVNVVNVSDVVYTNESHSDISMAKVLNVYRNVEVDSDLYIFICQTASIKKIKSYIYSILREEKIDYSLRGEKVRDLDLDNPQSLIRQYADAKEDEANEWLKNNTEK